ncbi:MAG TPA: phosphate ABC transporter ATP-binding protein [Anaerolineales bacterium]|nr:phosphate ABC transporter ATP-binding protein [Anaerolineaceae bacterium]HJO91218.1 phosphate ABC transporter ATP-binding protein [Anaerolineales bacterium]|tara:strand:- start:208 stop:969 length:762 start_codon:yes stop_codon:yes gene_type:complete
MFDNPKIRINELSVEYDDGTQALSDVCLDIPKNAITALFGPAGGGKSTLLRTLNRLNDLLDVSISGEVILDDINIFDRNVDVISLRRRVGIVFAQPIPLPFSIRKNITYGLELAGERRRAKLDDAVEGSLRSSALWDEVKDRLNDSATALSGGQQQRLCIARVLALAPEVLLLDEPTSGLDPISTAKVESSLQILKQDYTVVIAPSSIQQTARIADLAVFMLQGELVEWGRGKDLFSAPREKQTEEYITGRFG